MYFSPIFPPWQWWLDSTPKLLNIRPLFYQLLTMEAIAYIDFYTLFYHCQWQLNLNLLT
jgi:hypothetical protein